LDLFKPKAPNAIHICADHAQKQQKEGRACTAPALVRIRRCWEERSLINAAV
jgi:hypothetical protein